jgi:hypothetical protein
LLVNQEYGANQKEESGGVQLVDNIREKKTGMTSCFQCRGYLGLAEFLQLRFQGGQIHRNQLKDMKVIIGPSEACRHVAC